MIPRLVPEISPRDAFCDRRAAGGIGHSSSWIHTLSCPWNNTTFYPLSLDSNVAPFSIPRSLVCSAIEALALKFSCQFSAPRLRKNTFSTPTSSQWPSVSIKRGPPESPSHGSVILPSESKLLVYSQISV